MVHRCCISSCGMNVRVAEAKGLSYHTFPLKEPQREKWIAAILPHIDKPSSFKVVQGYSRICSRHFSKKDYSLDSKKRARLSSNAVPSIFPEKGSPLIVENVLENVRTSINESSSVEEQEKGSPVRKTDQAKQGNQINKLQDPPKDLNKSLESTDNSETKEKSKKRKRRKQRAVAPKSIRDAKRKSSANVSSSADELSIEGVGEALAEIKLNKLLSISPTAVEHKFAVPREWKTSLKFQNLEKDYSVDEKFRGGPQNESLGGSVESLCSSLDDNFAVSNTKNVPLVRNQSANNIDSELLLSIQAVNINSIEPERLSAPVHLKTEPCTSSESESDAMPLYNDFEESLLSSLRLNDDINSLSSFNDQVLGDSLENKLAFDLSSCLLHNCVPGSFDMNEINLPVFDSSLQEQFGYSFSSDDLISDFQNMSAISDSLPGITPVKSALSSEVPNLEKFTTNLVDASHSSSDCSAKYHTAFTERRSPVLKRNKRRKTFSGFSVDRFCDSDKDIEYYTGFSTYTKLEAFFQTVQAYAVNLKSEIEAKKMLSLLTSSKLEQLDPSDITSIQHNGKDVEHVDDILECAKVHGGLVSRLDELFLTIIRLKRKLPEKVLGHMFCISQPVVSRIIRRWTLLLSKIIESSVSEEILSSGSDKDGDGVPDAKVTNNIEIPHFLRQLLSTDFAKTITSNSSSTSVSRKTSSTTNCHSTSKSKRLKKERVSTYVSESVASSPTSPIESPPEQTTAEDLSVKKPKETCETTEIIASNPEDNEINISAPELTVVECQPPDLLLAEEAIH